MVSPNRAKLPDLIEDLLANAPAFGLFQALAVVERAWAEGGRVGDGLDRWLRVEPYAGQSFPPGELRSGYIDDSGKLCLRANVLGLYGVDAPMPSYVVEAADRDDALGQRVRDFLDMFNHRLYALLYEAWRVERAVDLDAGAGYLAQVPAVAGSADEQCLAHAGSLGARPPSAAALATMVEVETGLAVEVRDGIPQWLQIPAGGGLGAESAPCLGSDALLGDAVQIAGERIDVRVGPLSLGAALELLPGHAEGERALAVIRRFVGATVPFDLVVRARPGDVGSQALGATSLPLGWSTWLGERVDEEVDIRITRGRGVATACVPTETTQ